MKRFIHTSYDEYVVSQIEETNYKLGRVAIQEEEIRLIALYLGPVKLGLCHGVRTGKEVDWFHYYTGAEVLGTEICPSLKKANVITWDFHRAKKEWKGKFDFIYSNALDHSYDPEACIHVWINCLNRQGLCIIRWDETNNQPVGSGDCTQISFSDMYQLSRSYLRDVLKKRWKLQHYWFVLGRQVPFL